MQPQLRESRVAGLLEVVANEYADQEHDREGCENRPPLPCISDHLAEGVCQGSRNHEDQEHLQQIAERSRILEGMRRICVEEPTTICSQHLDGFLRSHWSLRDGLFRGLDRGRFGVRMQILDHALRHQQKSTNNRNRQKHVHGGAGDVHPEVADGLLFLPGETAN